MLTGTRIKDKYDKKNKFYWVKNEYVALYIKQCRLKETPHILFVH